MARIDEEIRIALFLRRRERQLRAQDLLLRKLAETTESTKKVLNDPVAGFSAPYSAEIDATA